MTARVYSVTPPFAMTEENATTLPYLERVTLTAQATEEVGWHGILVPHSFHEIDPWAVASCIGAVTDRLEPLVAVQPASVPPHSVAAFAASFAALYGRPLHLNLVAGARDDEMRRVGDGLTHDQRYERIARFGQAVRTLVNGDQLTHAVDGYAYDRFRLDPRPPAVADSLLFVAGSSTASIDAAVHCADVVVTHPLPIDEWRETDLRALENASFGGELAIRVGIVCRETTRQAWDLAHARFPPSGRGNKETVFKTRSSNVWSRRLAERALDDAGRSADDQSNPYWLGAFKTGRVSSPFLVGSYEDVARHLAPYLNAGVRHILVNGLTSDDYPHTAAAISFGEEIARQASPHNRA